MAYFGVWGACVVADYNDVSVVGSENNVFSVLWVVGVCSVDMAVESPGTSNKGGGGGVAYHVYR